MADAAISCAVAKLRYVLIHKVNFLLGIEEQVRWVKDELQSMQCFLKDAVEKQSSKEYGNLIRKWISDVRVVAQDAEDAIEMLALKLDAPTRNRALLATCDCFPVHVSHLNRVGTEIESIRRRLHEIGKRRERYGIQNLEPSSTRRWEMVRFQKHKYIVGLNDDMEFLLNKILEEKREGLSVAAIVGLGGIGKSTLARKIYNHPAVAARFEKRAWVVVSSEFEAQDIMKQIMHQLSLPLDPEELKDLECIQEKLRRQEMLQEMLRYRLKGKHYFIVLDDLWSQTHWEALENAFPDEQDITSQLLFTSRMRLTFKNRHAYIHNMKFLSQDESWELLLKTTFIGRSEGRYPLELEDIGREILNMCNGLPLAITVAGGLLVNKEESETGWVEVLKQMKYYHLRTLSEIGSINVSTILELSYQNLPWHLKPCFLCLAFFKEDTVIRAKRLVQIWVVLGFVQAGEESVEEMAKSYLYELINRNLVQVKVMSIDDGVKYCHVHDLVRDLSIWKATEEIGFESLDNLYEGSASSSKPSSNKARHRVVRGMGERLITDQNKHLRSLFLHVEGPNAHFFTPTYWKSFQLLRVLDIEASRLPSLPSTFRALVGLRYLRLREVCILPRWLDVLKNLEVLDLADCKMVIFPDVTWKMDSLRHLYINSRYTNKLSDSMKKSTWKNLETLKYVSTDFLSSDNPIQGFGLSLRKLGVEVMDGEGEAKLWKLLAESEVQVLHLRFFGRRDHKHLPIPNSLEHLTKLKLYGPLNWCPTIDSLPRNITHLTLSHSLISENDPMQELGKLPKLLFLKLDLAIMTIESIKVSHEGFPRLKVLDLRNMLWLQNIEIEEGGMPELQRLQIHECPKLQTQNLREHFGSAEIIIGDDYFGS